MNPRKQRSKTNLAIWLLLSVIAYSCSKDDGPKTEAPTNTPPVANAGPDQKVEIGTTVNLNGVDSSDPDNDTLTYKWKILNKPTNSIAEITGSTAAQATFLLDKAGRYELELTVSDGENETKDQIEITNMTPIINAVDYFTDYFPAFTEGALTARNRSLRIKAAYLSKNLSENKVTVNGQECVI